MAKVTKPQRYGKGGRFRGPTISRAGISAIEQQSKRTTDALKQQALQQKNLDKMMISDLDRKNKLEQQNAKELYTLEVDAPYKARMNALKTNAETEIKSFRDQAAEYDRLAGVWGRLSPSLAKNFQSLAQSTTDYIQTTQAIDEFDRISSDGTLENIYYTFNRLGNSTAYDDAVDQRHKLHEEAQRGNGNARQEFEYLSQVLKTNNPVLQKLLYKDIKTNFDGIEQDLLASVENDVDKVTVTRLYQTKAMQLLKQLGINPKSENGFKIQELFRNKGLIKERQLTLEQEYMSLNETIEGGLTQIEASLDADDYASANAKWKEIQTSINALPIKSREGVYSRRISLNKREDIEDWAKKQASSTRYSGPGGWIKYQAEVLGKTPATPFGYEINGATGNKEAKYNRLLGKFPNLEAELREHWASEDLKTQKALARVNDRRLQFEAKPYRDKLNKGLYKNKDGTGYNAEFWNDWSRSNGNSYARAIFGEAMGFATGNIDENTLSSTLVQEFKRGNMMNVYSAWATSYTDDKQAIGFVMQDLSGLAQSMGVEVTELDETLMTKFNAKVKKIYGHGTLDQTLDESGTTKAKEILGATLGIFSMSAGTGKSIDERFNDAEAAVNVLLGIDNKTGEVNDFVDGFRGEGIFRQKRSNKMGVIFVRDAGLVFDGTTSIEIDDELTGKFNRELNGKARESALMGIVQKQLKNIDSVDLYNFLKGQPTNDRLLNHLIDEQMGDVDPVKFKNKLTQAMDVNAELKKNAIQWGAKQWIDHYLGATATGDLEQDAFTIGIQTLEKETGIQAWEFFLNPALRERLRRPE
tara:strand:+ start:114 stop:2549 length:2436 start_codon:yes stop_codon:yes gene_type:complete